MLSVRSKRYIDERELMEEIDATLEGIDLSKLSRVQDAIASGTVTLIRNAGDGLALFAKEDYQRSKRKSESVGL
jgi:hypothetical protein